MPTNAPRLSDRQLNAGKAPGKDFVLSDGDGLQLSSSRQSFTKSRILDTLAPAQSGAGSR